MKHLQRRIIIREYDYNRMVKQAVPDLYDSATFTPLLLKELEQEYIMNVLSDKIPKKLSNQSDINEGAPYSCYEYPRSYLWYMQHNLYDKNYVNWFSEYDADGYMWIQSRKNTPRTVLGWGTFNLDYE